MLEDINTVAETAAYLRLSERKVKELARSKRLAGIKPGRDWIFPRDAITEYVARNTTVALGGKAPTEPVNPRRTGRKF